MNGKQEPLPVTDPGDAAGAWAAYYAMLHELKSRLDADPDAPRVRDGAVGELAAEYRRSPAFKRLATPTRRIYAHHLNWLAGEFGGVAVARLRAAAVEEAAEAAGAADGTRRLRLAVVRVFLRWCGRPGVNLHPPAANSRGAECVISPAEYDRLLAHARGDFGPLLRFLWLTGCRPGEARSLTAEGVDWASGTVTLAAHKTRKKGRKRVLYLSPAAAAVLAGQRAKHPTGHLFRNRAGEPLSDSAVRQGVRRVRERAGGRADIIAYGFRHTLATRALEAGMSASDVAALLGHASTRMVEEVYSHVTANARRLREQAARLDGPAGGVSPGAGEGGDRRAG